MHTPNVIGQASHLPFLQIMYTLEQLRGKNLNELKEIGWQLNVLPTADRRCRQNWIDALVGVNPPLLQLLEASPAAEVEPVQEAIEIQHQEPIEIQHQEPIENSPGVNFDSEEFRQTHAFEIENYFASFTEADRPPNRGDNGRDRLESEAEMLESAIGSAAKNLLDAEADDRNPILIGVTFSDRFLARYSPPQSENIHYQADANGQLSLLDFEVESEDEPPDPDDFESMFAFWAAYDAWCQRTDDDSVHNQPTSVHNESEPLEVLLTSLDSMCEWAPCPDEWYEPETLLEPAEVLEVSPTIRASSTCNFSIPTFDAWCDRTNNNDEPPTAGVGARLPLPKPPSFSPMAVAAGDRYSIKQFARSAILLSGRAPPGGDAM